MATKNIKTEWDLSVFYKSPEDPQIEKDLKELQATVKKFEATYKKTNFLKNEATLLKALEEYEDLQNLTASPKAYVYANLYYYTHNNDPKAPTLISKVETKVTESINTIIFFELILSKLDTKQQKKFLSSKKLAHFHYFLENLFKRGKHLLTEEEEKIINLTSLPGKNMWVKGQEKVLGKLMIPFQEKNIPLAEAGSRVSSLPTDQRRDLHQKIIGALKNHSSFAEAEMNAIITYQKITDDLKGYKKPYSSTLLDYQNDEKTLLSLLSSVTKNQAVSHKFFKLKANLLNIEKFEYADRGAVLPSASREFSFDETVNLLKRVFDHLPPWYHQTFERFLKNAQIDVFPKAGKEGGGLCWSNINLPTVILLNHTNNMQSVRTLAHEMGHAFHGELSKAQSPIYQGHTISVGEVASTFFENLALDELLKNATKEEKISLLHGKLNDEISTVFRQVAFFNFELELHNRVREKGGVSNEEMCILMNKHMQDYLGPLFELKPDDGHFYMVVSQLRRSFYVYSYAYGSLISSALYARYKKDNSYMKKIETFLSAGSSKSPYDIFKSIGIDTRNPNFFKEGLKAIEQRIIELEKLVDSK